MTAFHRTTAWLTLSARMRKLWAREVEAGEAVCIDCGRPIWPGQKWAVGHRLSAALHPELALEPSNLGPTHHGTGRGANCNQRAGGQDGAAKTNRARARKERGERPKW